MISFFKILKIDYKKNLFFFLLLNLFLVGMEGFSIGLILTILQSTLNQNGFLLKLSQQYLPPISNLDFIEITILIFFFIFFLKNFFIIFFNWWQAKYINLVHYHIQNSLFKRYLTDNLLLIDRINTGVKIRNIKSESSKFAKYLTSWMNILVEGLIIIGLLFLISINDYRLTIIAIFIFLFFFTVYLILSKIYLYKWAKKNLEISKVSSLFLSEGLKFIKDIYLFTKQDYFLSNFAKNEKLNFNLATKSATFNQTPRVFIELAIVITITVYLILILNSNQNLNLVLVNIGFYFIIGLRFFPACTKIINSLNQIRNSSPSIKLLYNELDAGDRNFEEKNNNVTETKLTFANKIKCKNFSYRHVNNEIIFKNANLDINKNEKILITSPSGTGKSTFLNILSGLIKVNEGNIFYDDFDVSKNTKEIRNIIGYLSQESFILNESLLFNITFENSINKLNKNLFNEVIKITQLNKIFSNSVIDLNFQINENGSNFSGGERQRIALSRILYKDPQILILDEPTNEMDNESEDKIISLIKKTLVNKTIIMTTHNKSLSKYFDKCYEIRNNKFESY
jgi:ABC-type bacteriocin/lantibiotic exporter with double-glycine peptidase domain